LEPARVALLACHWIGDTFWATQVVPALRSRYPTASIFAITKPFTRDLWNGLIEPEHIVEAPQVVSDRRRERVSWRAIARRARELRELDLDLLIDLTGNRYSAFFTFLVRPRVAVGFEGGELGWLYSHRVAGASRPGAHLSEQPFRVIAPLLAGRWAYPPQLRPPQSTVNPDVLLAELNLHGPYTVIAPGAGWPAKQWPAENFAQVAAGLAARGQAVVAVGSDDQAQLCRQVARSAGPAGHVLSGRPIGQIVALLSRAAGALANDSGIAHLSAALGRPTVAVFSRETDPALCGPLGPPGTVTVLVEPDVQAVTAAMGG
jgi:heptosyltransferase-1